MKPKTLIQLEYASQTIRMALSVFEMLGRRLEVQRIFDELKLCAKHQGFKEDELEDVLRNLLR